MLYPYLLSVPPPPGPLATLHVLPTPKGAAAWRRRFGRWFEQTAGAGWRGEWEHWWWGRPWALGRSWPPTVRARPLFWALGSSRTTCTRESDERSRAGEFFSFSLGALLSSGIFVLTLSWSPERIGLRQRRIRRNLDHKYWSWWDILFVHLLQLSTCEFASVAVSATFPLLVFFSPEVARLH